MTTLFDVGDEITVTLNGRIKRYTNDGYGDCYTICVQDSTGRETDVYMSTEALKLAGGKLNADALTNRDKFYEVFGSDLSDFGMDDITAWLGEEYKEPEE